MTEPADVDTTGRTESSRKDAQSRSDGLTWFLAAFVAMCAVVGAIYVARNSNKSDGQSSAVATTTEIHLTEYTISPQKITAHSGDRITVINDGTIQHDVIVSDTEAKVSRLAAGDKADLDLTGLEPGTYTVICSVAGHESLGMTATLEVVAGASNAVAAGADAGSTIKSQMAAAGMDEMAAAKVKAFPAKTKGTGDQPLAPTIEPDGTKVFELTADETDWEVEPGKVVQAMAYNGQIPGPRIQVATGDKVKVILHNKLEESTVIHFHGLLVPNAMDGVPDITQPPVKPGESFTYEFVARGLAVGMYHSHHDASVQVPAGLAGAFIIGELPKPAGPPVSQELVMVLNDSGPIGLTLNGKSFPATTPIVTKFGDRILLHYLNEGEMAHPMHLHGVPQLVIAKDGIPLPTPVGQDTILVGPGERYSVLVDATELGTWAWHCHILSHAERPDGMFGMVTALVVQEA